MLMPSNNGMYKCCKNEQEFKIKYLNSTGLFGLTFCIETEETVAGFPDVMSLNEFNNAEFFEFKYTKNHIIHFQPSQIAFYRNPRHKRMKIKVIAYDWSNDAVHYFEVAELFDKESQYCLIDGTSNVRLSVNQTAQIEKETAAIRQEAEKARLQGCRALRGTK